MAYNSHIRNKQTELQTGESSMKKGLVALMDGNEIVYTLGSFRGHCFREYPDGRIEAADAREILFLKKIKD